MMTKVAMKTEQLKLNPVPLLRRLWFRVGVALFLIGVISLVTCWWPRRTIIAAWRANAKVACDSLHDTTRNVLGWWDPKGTGWSRRMTHVWRMISWVGVDKDVVWMDLRESRVDDKWLENLKRFPRLFLLGLNDRQLGPGLDSLRDSKTLASVIVKAPTNGHLSELRRIPQIEILSLREVPPGEFGPDVLKPLTKLTEISFVDCPQIGGFLNDLPDLPNLKSFRIHCCRGFAQEELETLQRCPKLTLLVIERSAPINDKGLASISRLKTLETLILRRSVGDVSDEGFKVLQTMTSLKEIFVSKGDLTPQQMQTMNRLLPNVLISD